MKETLTCTNCNKNWKREKSRGRKPTLCPKCVKLLSFRDSTVGTSKSKQTARPAVKLAPSRKVSKPPASPKKNDSLPNPQEDPNQDLDIRQVYSMLSPKPKNFRELADSTKNGSTWQCPFCKHTITISVSILQPPAHRCSPTKSTEREFVRID